MRARQVLDRFRQHPYLAWMRNPNDAGSQSVGLRTLFPALAAATGCDDWEVIGVPMHRRNCAVHFLRSACFRYPQVVLKTFHPGKTKPKLAKELFAKSQVCHAGATAAYSVPEPIFLSHEHNAWAMERILVPTIGKRLKFGFPAAATRDGIARAAGGWLAWFHSCAKVTAEPFDAEYFLGKLETLREKAGSNDREVLGADQFLQTTLALTKEVAHSLHGVSLPHVSVHGDFTPFNLFGRGGQIVGFDFLARRRLPVSYDVCRFLLYLDLYRLMPTPAAELRKFGCRQRDFEAFAAGHGGDLTWTESGRWQRFQYLEVARRLTSLALRRSEGRKSLFGRIENARVRRTARHLAAGLG